MKKNERLFKMLWEEMNSDKHEVYLTLEQVNRCLGIINEFYSLDWFCLKQHLPKENQEVLVYYKGKVRVAKYISEFDFEMREGNGLFKDSVTSWAYLPKYELQ